MAMNHGLAQSIAKANQVIGTTTTTSITNSPHPSPQPYPPGGINPVPHYQAIQNKAPEQFSLWLLGVSDTVTENSAPSAEQWDMIKKRLYVVIGTLAADRLTGKTE